MNRSPTQTISPSMHRRRFLGAMGSCAVASMASASAQVESRRGALTKEERDRLTPDQVIDAMKRGNERFRAGTTMPRHYLAQQQSSAAGQFPAAMVLGCVDSRTPIIAPIMMVQMNRNRAISSVQM